VIFEGGKDLKDHNLSITSSWGRDLKFSTHSVLGNPIIDQIGQLYQKLWQKM
jgi:hypothetical protein